MSLPSDDHRDRAITRRAARINHRSEFATAVVGQGCGARAGSDRGHAASAVADILDCIPIRPGPTQQPVQSVTSQRCCSTTIFDTDELVVWIKESPFRPVRSCPLNRPSCAVVGELCSIVGEIGTGRRPSQGIITQVAVCPPGSVLRIGRPKRIMDNRCSTPSTSVTRSREPCES